MILLEGLPHETAFEPRVIGSPFGGIDVEDLAGGHLHDGRQDVPADQGIYEGALAPLGLPDHQHRVGVLPQLLGVPLEDLRRLRQLELLALRYEPVEDNDGSLANLLDLFSRVSH